MEWAALITWVVTAGGGLILLGLWLRGGGMSQSQADGRLIRPPLILTHFALAASGLVLWIIYVATDSDALAWVAFALLAVGALLGFTMLAIWLQQRQASQTALAGTPPPGGPVGPTAPPAERGFPVPVVIAHGLVAAATLILVLLTAADVG